MPEPAQLGTYPHPGIPGATFTAGTRYTTAVALRWLNGPAQPLAVDIETYGLGVDMLRIKCVTIATEAEALILDPRSPADAFLIRDLLAWAPVLFMHIAYADAPSLARNRLMDPRAVWKVVDTALFARIHHPGETVPKTLEACAQRYLGIPSGKITDVFKALGYSKADGYRILDIDSPAYLHGAAADGIVTARIAMPAYRAAIDRLTTGHPFVSWGLSRTEAAEEVEKHQIVNRWALGRAITGLKVDFDYLEQYRAQNGAQRAAGEAELRAAGIAPGNGNQLATVLGQLGALPVDHPRTPTGKVSTKAENLEALKHPLARTFLAVKQMTKIEDDYLQKCVDMADENGRIHPITKILQAAHGRSGMADPPIHQFPGPARGIVVFDDEEGGSIDWSQQEPRIMINAAGDAEALRGYEERGEKLYTAISEYGQIPYDDSKVVLLAGMYGEGRRKLSADLGLAPDPWIEESVGWGGKVFKAHWGYQAAKDMQDAAFAAIPRSREFLKKLTGIARTQRQIFTVNGRILDIPMGPANPELGLPAGPQTHKGPNFFICGSALDEWTDAMVACVRAGISDGVYFGMHDELVVTKSIMHDVKRIMETPSERFCRIAGRRPVIRTDMAVLGERWGKG